MSKMLWEASFAIFSIHLISNWLFFLFTMFFRWNASDMIEEECQDFFKKIAVS